jgi:hypothetical protein
MRPITKDRLILEDVTDILSRNVSNYQHRLRNIPEERRPQLHDGEMMESPAVPSTSNLTQGQIKLISTPSRKLTEDLLLHLTVFNNAKVNRKRTTDLEDNIKMCIEKCKNAKVLFEYSNSSIFLT